MDPLGKNHGSFSTKGQSSGGDGPTAGSVDARRLPGGVALVAPTAGAGPGATFCSSIQGHRHTFHLTVITGLNLIILSK